MECIIPCRADQQGGVTGSTCGFTFAVIDLDTPVGPVAYFAGNVRIITACALEFEASSLN